MKYHMHKYIILKYNHITSCNNHVILTYQTQYQLRWPISFKHCRQEWTSNINTVIHTHTHTYILTLTHTNTTRRTHGQADNFIVEKKVEKGVASTKSYSTQQRGFDFRKIWNFLSGMTSKPINIRWIGTGSLLYWIIMYSIVLRIILQ